MALSLIPHTPYRLVCHMTNTGNLDLKKLYEISNIKIRRERGLAFVPFVFAFFFIEPTSGQIKDIKILYVRSSS
mgnify:CR=1 FL=1